MGETIKLTASDGFAVSAYRAEPVGTPIAGLVVVQEIFGVNPHIKRVADGFAAAGFLAIAPALYDRIRPGVELGYNAEDLQEGLKLRAAIPPDTALTDIAAARDAAASAGKVGIVGYCWGGLLSWLSATRLSGFSGAVVYYGGMIGTVAGERPSVPVLGHFGEKDAHIPLSDVEKLSKLHPDKVETHIYQADHGFNCDERASYDAPSAKEALERTLSFFGRHLRA